jgi:hypothetical protein
MPIPEIRAAGRYAWLGYDGPCPIRSFLWDRGEGRMDVAERARKSVVFIGIEDKFRGTFTPLGTGFLAVKRCRDIQFQHVITARHVLDMIDGDNVSIRVNVKEGVSLEEKGSDIATVPKSSWYLFPGTDPYIDVAVCPMMFAQHHYDIVHIDLDADVYDGTKHRPLEVGDEVFTTGLFTSHHGDAHNIPIARFGNIAATMDEPVLTEYGDMHGYLIEVKSLAGLSGSPVFVRFHAPGYIGGVPAVNFLIGLMHGHFFVENPEDAISPSGKDRTTGQINTGIGLVIPAQFILDLVNHPDREAEREAAVEHIRKRSKVRADAAIARVTGAALPTVESSPPASDANPTHREDFTSLVSAAARKREQED